MSSLYSSSSSDIGISISSRYFPTVARMKGVAAGGQGRRDKPLLVEVAVGDGCLSDADGPSGQAHVELVFVGLRIRGHALDAHLDAATDDPLSDLSAVCYQHSLEHGSVCLDLHEDVVDAHGRAVLGDDAAHGARTLGLDLVEHLHGLD